MGRVTDLECVRLSNRLGACTVRVTDLECVRLE